MASGPEARPNCGRWMPTRTPPPSRVATLRRSRAALLRYRRRADDERGPAVTVVISRWAGAGHRTTADVVATAEKARAEGFATLWLPQTLSFDAMTALA